MDGGGGATAFTTRDETPGFCVCPTERGLWVLAVLSFGVGDLLTTWIGQSIGLWECNPIFRGLFCYVPVPVVLIVGLGLQLLLAAWLSRRLPYPHRLLFPAVLSLLGIRIVVMNLQVIARVL